MASYRPSSELQLVKSCDESWEGMAGDSRKRHCGSCQCDVLNVAAMTPAELEAVIARPGPLPCLRVARYEDGSLLMATEVRRLGWWHRAVTAAAALMMTAGAMAQRVRSPRHTKKRVAKATVVDTGGAPTPRGLVILSDFWNVDVQVPTDAAGGFLYKAPPEAYPVQALAPGYDFGDMKDMVPSILPPGLDLPKRDSHTNVAVTMGIRAVGQMPQPQPKVAKAVKVDLGVRPPVVPKP